ncbi:MAG: lactate utilization protein [Fibrobacteres bacterium]|nr:lactate utilization protein [Fibrobacterota bacterium]
MMMNILNVLCSKFNSNNFESEVFETAHAAALRVIELSKGKTVGFGNSMTINSLNLVALLKPEVKQLFIHLPGKAGKEERDALTADLFLTSANAVSIDGHIVNIDGTGNRVAATCFGPGRVIYLIGKNKITENLPAALVRAKETAVNLAKHYNRKTPCVKTGKCEECQSPGCVCAVTTIHRRKPNGLNISVFLINEELGL